jgi:hypothetical protein
MSIQNNLRHIVEAPANGSGLDIVIVSTTTTDQENYWQQRLEAGRGRVCRSDALILAVTEDWPGGAGNGLGTLYALQTAALKAREQFNRDLMDELGNGAAVGLYHTAGKGTRLAPLPGSEGNNKPAVKLPATVEIEGRNEPLTILEAVIRQTAIYAAGRRGRVGVFWGDQVFIPSSPPPEQATHHVDILACLGPMPNAEAWSEQGLERYGLIAVGTSGDAAQVEKVDHATADRLIRDQVIAVDGGIGVSLGSFSMSAAMTTALLSEFEVELSAKTDKLDTDPHFWMPMTLDAATYRDMMTAKGIAGEEADAHHERMCNFLARVQDAHPEAGIFGCVDVGTQSWWWDYGTIDGYLDNNLKLLGDDTESAGMRLFFGLDTVAETKGPKLSGGSVLIDCDINSGHVHGSVLVGVRANCVETKGSVMVHVTCPEIHGDSLLLYNVPEADSLKLIDGTVRADAFLSDRGQVTLWSHIERDGKDDWHERLPGNDVSWDELHAANTTTDTNAAANMAKDAFDRISED